MFRESWPKRAGNTKEFGDETHDRVYGNFSNAPYYEVVSQVTVVDHNTPYFASNDPQKQGDPGTAPDPRWNCSRVY